MKYQSLIFILVLSTSPGFAADVVCLDRCNASVWCPVNNKAFLKKPHCGTAIPVTEIVGSTATLINEEKKICGSPTYNSAIGYWAPHPSRHNGSGSIYYCVGT